MDPIISPLVILGAGYVLGRGLKVLMRQGEPPSRAARDEVTRIGDATIDAMRQTSKQFREHIDRETRR